jgi:hypothetical protein
MITCGESETNLDDLCGDAILGVRRWRTRQAVSLQLTVMQGF